ncbi:MAG: hypothetical protein OCD01_00920 [Fibrobacterales bacterium]
MKKLILFYVLIISISICFGAKENPNNFGLLGQGKTFSARTMSQGTLFLGSSLELRLTIWRVENRSIYFYGNEKPKLFQTRSNGGELTVLPFISTALTRYIEASVSLPLYKEFTMIQEHRDVTEEDMALSSNLSDLDAPSLGDTELLLKIRYPFKHNPLYDIALLGSVSFPTGTPNRGFFPKNVLNIPKDQAVDGQKPVHQIYTASNYSFSSLFLLTFNFEHFVVPFPLELSVNYGMKFSLNPVLDKVRMFNVALEYYFTSSSFFVDFSNQTRLSRFSDGFFKEIGEDPMFLSSGIIFYAQNIHFSLALDTDLSSWLHDIDPNDKKAMETTSGNYTGVERLNIDRDGDGENVGTYYVKPMKYGVSCKIVWRGLFY